VVVDIFNRVNSGGTKLSKGDLALAKICAHWPEARSTMRQYLDTWHSAGYDQFTLDWLLRSANAVATGRAPFSALEHVDSETFRTSLTASADYLDTFLNAAAGRLGLDHGRVLMGRYAAPVVARFLHVNGGAFAGAAERDRMLFWYVHSALWGRFAGSTETVLAQDYEILHQSGIDGLITALERWRGGNLVISGHDFDGCGRGSRFYPLLDLLTRFGSARDFGGGLELHKSLLGKSSGLQVHHIFPKSLLYTAGYSRGEVNGIANYCFLTQDTNLKISNRRPAEYFVEVEAANPGALASQWIPEDPELWELERYPDFLAARRKLLAQAANAFLDELRSGSSATAPAVPRPSVTITDDGNDAEDLAAMPARLTDLGCALPETDAEIADPRSGEPVTVADAFWPDGLQAGQGSPVVLVLSPGAAVLAALQRLGYEVFTSAEALLDVAELRNVTASGAADQGALV
ncbi:MAG: hypothetical protein HOV66_01105, partial [Streptomycetaceae bacterium]|nr:hypothetical protein [Streptomycetaceae bacterium]